VSDAPLPFPPSLLPVSSACKEEVRKRRMTDTVGRSAIRVADREEQLCRALLHHQTPGRLRRPEPARGLVVEQGVQADQPLAQRLPATRATGGERRSAAGRAHGPHVQRRAHGPPAAPDRPRSPDGHAACHGAVRRAPPTTAALGPAESGERSPLGPVGHAREPADGAHARNAAHSSARARGARARRHRLAQRAPAPAPPAERSWPSAPRRGRASRPRRGVTTATGPLATPTSATTGASSPPVAATTRR
jgi:hypothetical protein